MRIISKEIVKADESSEPIDISFSPIDHLSGGHLVIGTAYGFNTKINKSVFRDSLKKALAENPEIGVSVIIKNGHHFMKTESGVDLTIQECNEATPDYELISQLPVESYPLSQSNFSTQDLIDRHIPLLGFTITYFSDGGCILGVRTTHSHLDGIALLQFIVNLGEIYNGGKVHKLTSARKIISEIEPPSDMGPSDSFKVVKNDEEGNDIAAPQKENLISKQIVIPKSEFERYIDFLKKEIDGLTSPSIVFALGWKAWALSSRMPDAQNARVYTGFNLRSIRELALPERYLGNAVILRSIELTFDEVRDRSVAELANFYNIKFNPLNINDVRKDIAFLNKLYLEGSINKEGNYCDYTTASFLDMAAGRAMMINDIRFLLLHKVKFSSEAIWFEPNQGDAVARLLLVSRRCNGDVVFNFGESRSGVETFEIELCQLIGHTGKLTA